MHSEVSQKPKSVSVN